MAMEHELNWKDARRKELKAARAALGAEGRAAADAGIAAQVMKLAEYEQADLLLPYLSFGAEVDTRELIADAWARGKAVALPRCIPGTRQMDWHRVTSFEGLVTSPFGVDEPADDPATLVNPATADHSLVIVPGLEFDTLGYRLGYGGGFYDVFLSTFEGTAIGLCRDQFLQDEPITHDDHDLPADIVVTQSRVIRK